MEENAMKSFTLVLTDFRRSVEIHLVHWNSKYDNFTYASAQDDGLAVLTVFAEVISC